MSTLHELLYASPVVVGLIFLLACAVASTSALYFCRPTHGPGFWSACCWLLVLTYSLFSLEYFGWPTHFDWIVNLLIIVAQALMVLGLLRFLGKRLPYWIIPASAAPILLMDAWRTFGHVPQPLVDAAYSLVVTGLVLKPLNDLRRSHEHAEVRAVRNFIIGSLSVYALIHALRALLGIGYSLLGDSSQLFTHHSIPILSFYSGLPFLVIALVALTAMSLHRTLAESRDNAELARAHLRRFEQLMRVGSAGTLLLRDGLIVDSNPKLGELFGCKRENLHGRPFADLFHPHTDHNLLIQGQDEKPLNLIAVRTDRSTFQSEVRLKKLDNQHDLAEIRDISRQKSLEAELERLARTDPLTGALNRRAFSEDFQKELERAKRHGTPLCLAMLDLDHFKQINDRHGHGVGDEVLVQFSQLCRQQARSSDVFARFGGEEFALLLPNCRTTEAILLLNRLRATLQAFHMPQLPEDQPVTFSAGVVACSPQQTLDQMLQSVDQALYRAKHGGRNRIELADG